MNPAIRLRQRIIWRYLMSHSADEQWTRRVMDEDHGRWFDALARDELDAVEVSGERRGGLGWRTYRALTYPDFDLMAPKPLDQQWDVAICEQVLEHIEDPAAGLDVLFGLLRPGGRLLVSVPLLLGLHEMPRDFWRFTPPALERLLVNAGFLVDRVDSWGNPAAAWANMHFYPKYRRWFPLRNDPDSPLVVWAYATRPAP